MSLEDPGRRVAALRARAHPLRLQMLSLLTGAALSAAELARELDVSQALASYHLRQLADADIIELVEERNTRGGRERRYRYRATKGEPPSAGVDDAEGRVLLIEALVDELRRRSDERDQAEPSLTVDAELWVTPEDWQAARQAVAVATIRLHEQAKRPHADGTVRVSTTVVMFPMTDADRAVGGAT